MFSTLTHFFAKIDWTAELKFVGLRVVACSIVMLPLVFVASQAIGWANPAVTIEAFNWDATVMGAGALLWGACYLYERMTD